MTPLHILAPCAASWATMTPREGGRHCAHCDRVVIDLTTAASAARALAVRRRVHAGGRVCIRAHVDPHGRVQAPPAVGLRVRLLTNGIAAMLAMTLAGCQGDGPALGASHAAPARMHAEPVSAGAGTGSHDAVVAKVGEPLTPSCTASAIIGSTTPSVLMGECVPPSPPTKAAPQPAPAP